NKTEEECLELVRKNGLNLIYIKNQTEEICLEAVRQNCNAIKCGLHLFFVSKVF
ncbi:DUF4116 domain-containing protein, partial [Clostridioides difficile]